MSDVPQGNRGHPSEKMVQSSREEPKLQFHIGWILVPLALVGMAYLLRHTNPAVTWEQTMDLLHVHNRERYTMLLHLCLALTFIVAVARILGRKDRK